MFWKSILKTTTLLIYCSLLTSINSNAATSGEVLTSAIRTSNNGITVMWTDSGWGSAISSCNTTNVVAFDSSTDAGKSMLSFVLAAHMAGRLIKVTVDDNNCIPVGGWASKVISVYVLN